MAEPLEAAAARELAEESGVSNAYLEQLYLYGAPERDPRERVISMAYFALIPANAPVRVEGGDNAAQSRWFPMNALPSLAFDHAEIVTYALRRLCYKLKYMPWGSNPCQKLSPLLNCNGCMKSSWGKNWTNATFGGTFSAQTYSNPRLTSEAARTAPRASIAMKMLSPKSKRGDCFRNRRPFYQCLRHAYGHTLRIAASQPRRRHQCPKTAY